MSALAQMIAKQKAAQESKPAPTNVSEAPASTAAPATGGAKLKFGVNKASVPAPAPATQAEVAKPQSVSQVVSDSAIMSLDDLGATEEAGESVRGSTSSGMAFDDEIPATAPERELSPDLTESQLAFVEQLNGIYEIIHDPELFGSMIRTIMTELQECPDYMSLMADQDVHTMIRGLRSSMGLAKIKKAEKSTKARGAKKAPATTAMINTADELFNSDQW